MLPKVMRADPHANAEQGHSADQSSRTPSDQRRIPVRPMNLRDHLGSSQAGALDVLLQLPAKFRGSLLHLLSQDITCPRFRLLHGSGEFRDSRTYTLSELARDL